MKRTLSLNNDIELSGNLNITGSKSESNRLLILQAHFPQLSLTNVSNSDDTRVLKQALSVKEGVVDIHHAGTAMRFLTSYFASLQGASVILTGSERMKQRPVKLLVDALFSLGAQISYEENEGYPPLRIEGRALDGGQVSIPGNISSQYISSLILMGPILRDGLKIHLTTPPTSLPYLKMTLDLLTQLGITNSFDGQEITISPGALKEPKSIAVESDWSSASYFYSILALSPVGVEISLSTYKKNSLQGDSRLAEIYADFGVETIFADQRITLKKTEEPGKNHFSYNLADCPDLAQTIAVTCLGRGAGCDLGGLHTLKIKETDRLEALKNECSKFGAQISITEDSLSLEPLTHLQEGVTISTYNDHRMAMAFAPIAIKTPLSIEDSEVVTKSYPDFWVDMATLGFTVSES